MQLQFSLEDDNPEVNIDIDEDSISIEIKNIEDEIEEADEKIEAIFNVINNLSIIKNHVKKFGITREFLHLVNSNNSLGSAIGLMLPYYESESENLDQITEDELPDVEVVVETIGEAVGKAKDAIIKGFKWLAEKMAEFYNFLKKLWPFKSNKMKEAAEKLKEDNIIKAAQEKNPNKDPEEVKEAVKEIIDEPIPNKIFKHGFLTKDQTFDIIKNLENFLACIQNSKLDATTGELTIDVDILNQNINNRSELNFQEQNTKKLWFSLENGKLLKTRISRADAISKGYKPFTYNFNNEDDTAAEWKLEDLNKLNKATFTLGMTCHTKINGKDLEAYYKQITQKIKEINDPDALEQEGSELDILKLTRHNLSYLLHIQQRFCKQLHNFLDIVIKACNEAYIHYITHFSETGNIQI